MTHPDNPHRPTDIRKTNTATETNVETTPLSKSQRKRRRRKHNREMEKQGKPITTPAKQHPQPVTPQPGSHSRQMPKSNTEGTTHASKPTRTPHWVRQHGYLGSGTIIAGMSPTEEMRHELLVEASHYDYSGTLESRVVRQQVGHDELDVLEVRIGDRQTSIHAGHGGGFVIGTHQAEVHGNRRQMIHAVLTSLGAKYQGHDYQPGPGAPATHFRGEERIETRYSATTPRVTHDSD